MSGPVAVLSTVASWWTLIKLFPAREASPRNLVAAQMVSEKKVVLFL